MPSKKTFVKKLEEQVDMTALKIIIDNFDTIYDASWAVDVEFDTPKDKQQLLTSLTHLYEHKTYFNIVDYNYAKGRDTGRLFAPRSLQGCPRKIRHTIAHQYYWDIDMVNAHPTILEYLCTKKYNIECPYLTEYVKSRDEVLTRIIEEDDDINNKVDAKGVLLALINGGKRYYAKKPNACFLRDFALETKRIASEISKSDPKAFNKAKKQNKDGWDNDEAVFVNLQMCIVENNLLTIICRVLTDNGYKIGTLCFDGCMIYKKADEDVKNVEEVLEKCVEAITMSDEYRGLNMKLSVKPMNEILNLEGMTTNDEEDKNTTLNYEDTKHRFEETTFFCVSNANYYTFSNNDYIIRNKNMLVDAYEHIKYKTFKSDEVVLKCFITEWVKDQHKRLYERVDIYPPPTICPKDCFNLWRGFMAEKMTLDPDKDYQEGLEFIKAHILYMCNNEQACYDYLIKWIAHMFQVPAEKNGIIVLLKSIQGMGKDLIYRFLERMIGYNQAVMIEDPATHVFGVYNNVLLNKLLVGLDEFSGAVGFKFSDRIKNLVTSPSIIIHGKNRHPLTLTSHTRYMSFTNTNYPLKIEKGDRRCFPVECLLPPPSTEYFDKLRGFLSDDGHCRAFYDYLMSIDIKKVDWINDRPITDIYKDLMTNSESPEMMFIRYYIDEVEHLDNIVSVKASDFYELFKSYLNTNCMSNVKVNGTKFGLNIKNLQIDGLTKDRVSSGFQYILDLQKIKTFVANIKPRGRLIDNNDEPKLKRLLLQSTPTAEEEPSE